MPQTILVVEDDALQRTMISALLEKRLGYRVVTAEHGKQAVSMVEAGEVDAFQDVLLDLAMPVMNGFDALQHIRRSRPDLPVIVLTAELDTSAAVKAIKEGAFDFINKPPNSDHLQVVLANAMKMSALSREVVRLKRDREGATCFDDLIGSQGGLQESVKLGRKASAADVSVLISGETGVGKEQFARAIHGESRRVGAPFIAINCGAIPENLLESILFGHEKGAFTGAVARSIGKFREAEGGTLFLDEIGELPADGQVKLLRALQQREVEPVGASRPVKVNVRILSASNRDLRAEVKAGRFREDLYFRLNVLPISLPPLRERKQDILPLAHYFLQRFATTDLLPLKALEKDAEAYLLEAHWSGNVRELENLIHRASVLSDGKTLSRTGLMHIHEMGDLSSAGGKETGLDGKPPVGLYLALRAPEGGFKSIDRLEKEAMQTVLDYYGGNTTRAAEALGIAKSTFYRKMKG